MEPMSLGIGTVGLAVLAIVIGGLTALIKQVGGDFWQEPKPGHHLIDLVPLALAALSLPLHLFKSAPVNVYPKDWGWDMVVLGAILAALASEKAYTVWKRRAPKGVTSPEGTDDPEPKPEP